MIRVPAHFYQQSIIYRYLTKQENYKQRRAQSHRRGETNRVSKTRSQVNLSNIRNQSHEDKQVLSLKAKGQSGEPTAAAARPRTESMNVQSQQPLNPSRDEDNGSSPRRDGN